MFRTNVRVPRPRAAGVRRGGAALGSCEGAADFGREGATSGRTQGAAGAHRNLTKIVKFFGAASRQLRR